ncbi:DMT family transporter [bacterium]|nr:DMT family transporter [bacterium]
MDFYLSHIGQTLALGAAIAWAIAVIFFKKSGETVHPIGLNLYKNALASVLLLPTIWLFGGSLFRNVPASEYLLLMASGALGIGISDTLFFMCLNRLGAGLTAIVECLYSPSIIFLSFLWLGERMTPLQIVGTLLIISAVFLATVEKPRAGLSRRDLILGITYGALALVVMAVGIVMIKPLLERSPLLWVTEVRLIASVLILLLILIVHPARHAIIASAISSRRWGYTLSGSFMGAYLSMILWLGGMKYAQASIAAVLNQTSNIFLFIFAALLLKEPINLQRIVAILLGVAGAILVTVG